MTEKEIERIKAEWFDRGCRCGLGVGLGIAVLAEVIYSIAQGLA